MGHANRLCDRPGVDVNADPASAALVTVLFSVTAAYYLGRAVVGFSWADRVNNVTHVLMSAVMLAMPWPWFAVVPAAAQIVVFTIAALWYVYLLLFRPGGDVRQLLGHHAGSVPLLWYHAFMMASMVWMAVAMSPSAPAMDVPGMSMAGMSMHSGGMVMTGTAGWAVVVSVIVGVVFVVAAGWFVVLVIVRAAAGVHGRDQLVVVLDTAGSTVMAAGMAFVFLVVMR